MAHFGGSAIRILFIGNQQGVGAAANETRRSANEHAGEQRATPFLPVENEPPPRLLVEHTLHAYEHDPRHESYGLEAAEALGVPPERVFKTLVAEVDGQLAVGVVPVAGTAAAPRDTRFFVLNGSAERLWDFLSSPQSARSMARHLTDEYGIAMSAAENDVLAFLKDLELNGLIVPETNQ